MSNGYYGGSQMGLEFKKAEWFGEECELEAWATRRIPMGETFGMLDTVGVELLYTIAKVDGEWRASLWAFDGGPFHMLAGCFWGSEDEARRWCNMTQQFRVLAGDLDEDIKQLLRIC